MVLRIDSDAYPNVPVNKIIQGKGERKRDIERENEIRKALQHFTSTEEKKKISYCNHFNPVSNDIQTRVEYLNVKLSPVQSIQS